MIRWFRVVLPSSRYLGIICASFLLIPLGSVGAIGLTYCIEMGTTSFDIPQEFVDLLWDTSVFFVVAACLLYGVYRAVYFHPVFRPEYAKWLANTPWNSTKPLPLGPIRLVWQDLVLLAGVEALAVFVLGLPGLCVVFVVGYLLALAGCLLLTEMDGYAFAIFYGLPGLVLLHAAPLAVVVGAVLLYLLAWRGIRSSLAQFPWRSLGQPGRFSVVLKKEVNSFVGTASAQARRSSVGWPYASLSCDDAKPWLSLSSGILLALLPGWACFAMICANPPEKADESFWHTYEAVVFAFPVLFRLGIYCCDYRAPINPLGRILTGRFVIPGYDIVFVAPLVALLTGLGLVYGLPLLGAPIAVSVPLSLTAFLLLIINLGPSMPAWQLSGSHRLSFLAGKEGLKRI